MHVSSLTKDAQTARRQLDDTDSESEESEGKGNFLLFIILPGLEEWFHLNVVIIMHCKLFRLLNVLNLFLDEATNKNRRASKQKLTEEQVEKLEEKLEAVQADQKNLFLIIFQVFYPSFHHFNHIPKDWIVLTSHWFFSASSWFCPSILCERTPAPLPTTSIGITGLSAGFSKCSWWWVPIPLPFSVFFSLHYTVQTIFTSISASQAGGEVQQHTWDVAVHPGPGPHDFGHFPTVCRPAHVNWTTDPSVKFIVIASVLLK